MLMHTQRLGKGTAHLWRRVFRGNLKLVDVLSCRAHPNA
jgi:hypothetical protein